MDGNMLDSLFVFLGLMTTLGCLTKVLLVILHRRRALPDLVVGRLDDMSAQLRRMEQAIDTTALEVERISEGQRFTTKLLADGQSSASTPIDSRGSKKSVTPH